MKLIHLPTGEWVNPHLVGSVTVAPRLFSSDYTVTVCMPPEYPDFGYSYPTAAAAQTAANKIAECINQALSAGGAS